LRNWWRALPAWVRGLLAALALVVVLYWFGFFLFSCGSESGSGVGESARNERGGEVHFAT
jgi:type VI protein secretion system component VasF